MSSTIILHQFPHSHYCIRIRWLLHWKGLPFTVVNYTHSSLDELRAITRGWRQVPVLQWDKEVVVDSPRIARFLEAKVPEPPIYHPGASPALCDVVNSWCDVKVMLTAAKFLAAEFLDYIGNDTDRALYTQRFKKTHGILPEEAAARKDELEVELMAHWELLNELLEKRDYLMGDKLTYADLGVASRLSLMERVDNYRPPSRFTNINRWYPKVHALGD